MADEESEQSRPTSEGVRIIGAEEAAAALESGQAVGRRDPEEPRFGDVPPAPAGPRPEIRFPLPENADAEEIRPVSAAPPPAAAAPPSAPAPELPHWTEPPTGEVPKILAGEEPVDEELGAWSSFAKGPRWRDQHSTWDEDEFSDASMLADEHTRVGALDPSRPALADPFSFEETVEPEAAPAAPAPGGGGRRARPARSPRPPRPPRVEDEGGYPGAPMVPPGGRDMGLAIGTGLAFGAVALLVFKAGPMYTLALVTAVVLLCVAEVFAVLRRAGYRPATLLGLAATVSLMTGAYWRGETAIPLVIALTVVFTMLWYLAEVVRGRPTVNVAMTLFGFMWVGFLGSFGALLLRIPNRWGVAFVLGMVLCVVANDVGGLFFGKQMGRTPLSPRISPNKTVEGLLGGMATSVVVALVVVSQISPWEFGSAFWLGVVIAVVAPLGDLCESMIKRDIGIKDMGNLLPGHGGLLDRFDAALFALPATYYLVRLLEVGT